MRNATILAMLALAGPVAAQDLTALDTIQVDACSRHEVQMAEMSRGRGANSNNIASFVSWTEINTYIAAYVEITGHFEDRDAALRYLVDQCRENPSTTIRDILYERWSEETFQARFEQLSRERELQNQIHELEERLAEVLSNLITATTRIEELESQ